ncbi:MAG TPA: hypothetical protein ENJ41_08610 [Oceanospirillales bacterium]|nr:hypothetical protein [Oceanospirillales bacterium]
MKKLLLLAIMALFINGCRYIDTKEKYVNAHESPKLIIPAGVDEPNSSSTLEVPKITAEKIITEEPDRSPPDMPIRTQQSDSGALRVENIGGYPVLTVKTDKLYMWEAMTSIKLANWSLDDADESACVVILKYVDQGAKEREEAGFLRKLFTRDKFYTDYSGLYKVTCEQSGSSTTAKFSKQDGTAAKSFLADNVMNHLYEKFE